MTKERLKAIILEQGREISKKVFVDRERLPVIRDSLQDGFVKVFVGIRRAGKSTLLEMVRRENAEKDFYLNFDDERLIDFRVEDFVLLEECFIELFGEQNLFYFDEIQNVLGWERFVRRLHNQEKKVFVTGSNANLLSKELGTHLTGRSLMFEILPFSFVEFLALHKFTLGKNDIYLNKVCCRLRSYFGEYVKKGGFPEYLQTGNSFFLTNIFENIIYRDVIVRHKVRGERAMKELALYLLSNVGKEFSYTKLKSMFGFASATTVREYVSFLEESYLFFVVNRYNFSLKKQVVNPKKVYSIDTAFSDRLSFRFSEDRGRVLENIVFLQLRRQEGEIYYHREKAECDFVVRIKDKICLAVQVTVSLAEESTRQREVAGLLEACKTYGLKQGVILTEDEADEFSQDGVQVVVMPIWRWLVTTSPSVDK